MAQQPPKECDFCGKGIASFGELVQHIYDHQVAISNAQSQLSLVVRKLSHAWKPISEVATKHISGESLANHESEESGPLSGEALANHESEESGGLVPTQFRINRKRHACPVTDCRQRCEGTVKLRQHRLIHYSWKENCGGCSQLYSPASSYVSHRCNDIKPSTAETEKRQGHAEKTLGLDPIDGNSVPRRRRRRDVSATSVLAQTYTKSLQDIQGTSISTAGHTEPSIAAYAGESQANISQAPAESIQDNQGTSILTGSHTESSIDAYRGGSQANISQAPAESIQDIQGTSILTGSHTESSVDAYRGGSQANISQASTESYLNILDIPLTHKSLSLYEQLVFDPSGWQGEVNDTASGWLS